MENLYLKTDLRKRNVVRDKNKIFCTNNTVLRQKYSAPMTSHPNVVVQFSFLHWGGSKCLVNSLRVSFSGDSLVHNSSRFLSCYPLTVFLTSCPYLEAFILPSNSTMGPIPCQEKQPQIMTELLPICTVGLVHLMECTSPTMRRT